MKKSNIVVWGIGQHALKKILPALKMCSGLHLYGVCSRNKDVVTRCMVDFECRGWTDPERMLEDPKVDIVYLSTPIGLHAAQGMSVLFSGKHFWCEKPLTCNLEQTLVLVNLSRQLGLTIAEGFMYLYHPQFADLQKIVGSEKLGFLQRLNCRFGIPPLERQSFRMNPQLGGGAFLDVGSYPISAIISLFPKLNPEVLFSEIITPPESLVDSEGRVVLRYENGMSATLEWGINCSYRNEIDFWGEKGAVLSEHFFSKSAGYIPRFRFLDLNGNESYQSSHAENHFLTMFNAFCRLMHDSAGAENERQLVVRRAQLMEKIRQTKI